MGLICVVILLVGVNLFLEHKTTPAILATQPTVATVGQTAPDFILTDIDGKQYKLQDLRGNLWF